MIKLTLGYSTLAQRVGDMIPPPEHEGWQTSIVIQNPENMTWRGAGLAELMIRDDIEAQEIKGVGVAKSRNRAIWLAKGEYLVFADDDVLFHPEGLEKAIEFLDKHQDCALLLAQAVDETGKLRKRYPKRTTKLNRFNSARAATYEMIIRVEEIRQRGIWFDENFGAGVTNYLGDEYIFIVDLLSAGAKAKFSPITIATHPGNSSGARWGTERDRRARAAIFDRVFGKRAKLVRLAFGMRRIKELGGMKNLAEFVRGY